MLKKKERERERKAKANNKSNAKYTRNSTQTHEARSTLLFERLSSTRIL